MPRLLWLLATLFAYCMNLASARKILLVDENISMYSKKNISNIFSNIQALETNAADLLKIDDPLAKTCRDKFTHSADAYYLELKILGFSKKSRSKRSLLPVAGDIWSFISGAPSESDFNQMKDSFNTLKKAVNSEADELGTVESILRKDHKILEKSSIVINDLERLEEENERLAEKNEINLNQTEFTLEKQIRANVLCEFGNSIQDTIERELDEIKGIVTSAKFGFPNPHLFNPNRVRHILKITKNGKFSNIYSHSNNGLQQLYSTNAAITNYKDGLISSILTIPLVTKSQMLDLYDFKIKAEYSDRLHAFEKISNREIDLHICSGRTSALFSSRDLGKCMHNAKKSTFFCKQRKIKLYQADPSNCKNNILPTVLVFQVEKSKYIIEGTSGPSHLVCNGTVQKILNINKTITLNLPQNCHLENLNFFIDIEKNPIVSNSSEIESFSLVEDLDISQIAPKIEHNNIKSNLTDLKNEMKSHHDELIIEQSAQTAKLSNFSAEMDRVKAAHAKTRIDVDRANQNYAPHIHMGLSIGMITAVAIGIALVILIYCCVSFTYKIPINEH